LWFFYVGISEYVCSTEGRKTGEWWIVRALEGSDCSSIEALTKNPPACSATKSMSLLWVGYVASTHGKMWCYWENWNRLGNDGIDRRVMLRWIWRKQVVSLRTELNCWQYVIVLGCLEHANEFRVPFVLMKDPDPWN
jgi:hypothetical protein